MAGTLPCGRGIAALLLVVAVSAGCGPKRVVFEQGNGPGLAGKVPVRLLLAAPLDSLNLAMVRDALVRKYDTPERALARVRCDWGAGLSQLAAALSPPTEVVSEVLAETRTFAARHAIRQVPDALGTPRWSVVDTAAVAALAARGIDAVIVPLDLTPRPHVINRNPFGTGYGMNDTVVRPVLETPVAVVYVRTRAVAWSGVISSRPRNYMIGSTDYEREVGDWLIDLLDALGRPVRRPEAGMAAGGMGKRACPE